MITKKNLLQRPILIVFSLTIIISLFLYRDAFSSYFFQDDWFSLYISQGQSVGDVLNFFVPRSDVVYYRPLGMQLPFWIMHTLFGLNHFPYTFLTFIIHVVNAYIVYKLIRLLTRSEQNARLSMFLYATSATVFIPMYWFATFAFVLGPSAVFASLLGYILWLDNSKSKFLFLSVFFFILGLFIFEIAAVTPILMFLVSIIRKKIPLKFIMTIGLVTGIFFTFRFLLVSPTSSGAYEIALGRNVMTNIKAFFLWSLNWSEILTEQMQRPFIFNTVIEKNYPVYARITVITTLLILTLLLLPVVFYMKFKKKASFSVISIGIIWFIVGLVPVLPYIHHKFSYYVSVALVGLLIIISAISDYLRNMLKKFPITHKLYLVGILSCWVILSTVTLDLNGIVHWAPQRAKIAKEWVNLVTESKLNINKVVEVKNDDEVKFALGNQNAFRVIFNDPTIVTLYGRKEGSSWENIPARSSLDY